MKNFYQSAIKEVLTFLKVNPQKGLSKDQIKNRQSQYGPNRIKETHHRTWLAIFLEQFKNALVIILLIAIAISLYLGEYRDATVLFVIVLGNSLIGFYQEFKSERILKALSNLVVSHARVIRNNKEIEVLTSELIPGDIVLLEAGDRVPADLRLIHSTDLATNDFIITGESVPQNKSYEIIVDKETSITNQDNCLFMGMTVARGSAKGIVFATGMKTEIGQIATTSEQIKEEPSPLQNEIKDIAKKTIRIALIIAFFLFLGRLFFNDTVNEALIFAIAVAVAIVPEGLPAQISVALSLGVNRLSQKNAIVKRLSAVETLGSTTVIATDKTGTITKNEMTINHCFIGNRDFLVTGTGYSPNGQITDRHGNLFDKENLNSLEIPFLAGYLASTSRVNPPDEEHQIWHPLGDPTGAAFSPLVMKAGYKLKTLDKEYKKIITFPFDSVRKRLSIIRSFQGKNIVFAKGSLEGILDICTHTNHRGKVIQLTKEEKKKLIEQNKSYAFQALRVLAVAYKEIKPKNKYQIKDAESHLVFGGFVTMMDPPHEEVHEAVRAAFHAGLRIVMITGDNAITAQAIANMVGILAEKQKAPQVISGEDLQSLSDSQINSSLKHRAVIFSRVSPQDKFRIVKLLRGQGEVVAVTGDGVNDTLSLKNADIGVAMGLRGSEVAKEASDMILLDDNFSTIVIAIREGRVIYKNLSKTVIASVTSNFGELFCVLFGFAGGIFGLPTPILALQVLSIDLVGEMLPLTYLTTDPPDHDLMRDPPRDQTKHLITRRRLIRIVSFGFLMGLLGFLSFSAVYFLFPDDPDVIAKGRTAAWAGIILCQFMNILSHRTPQTVFTKYFYANRQLNRSFLISLGFVVLITYLPTLNNFLHTAPLSWIQWLFPIAGAFIFLSAHELRKKILGYPDHGDQSLTT